MSENKFRQLFDSETISNSGSSLSDALHMAYAEGPCSLEVLVEGDGTAKFTFLIGNSREDTVSAEDVDPPEKGGELLSSITSSDGHRIKEFDVPPCRYMVIKAEETGGTNSVTVSAWLAVKSSK